MPLQTLNYQERRQRLVGQIEKGDVVLIDSAGFAPNPTLADRNLCYLTGYTGRDALLLLVPGGTMVEYGETRGGPELARGRRVYEVLFVQQQGQQQAFMDGVNITVDTIKALSGVDRVYPMAQLEAVLSRVLMDTTQLWLNMPGSPALQQPLSSYLTLINQLRERFFWVQFQNIAPLIHNLRFVKDESEIAALRQAFSAQSAVFEEIMRTLKPGTNEGLAEGILEYGISRLDKRYRTMGSEGYDSSITVASGPNSLIPHHMANNRDIQDGDLVLIDACISYDGYYADISRTFPANGRFSSRQREIYSIVLEAQQAAFAVLNPGSTILAAHQAIYEVFKRHGVAQYSYGNCGHSVGLTIHDPHGRFRDDREQPLEPGVVLVIEPFLMLPDDQFGLRVEDGILITEEGHELLPGPVKEIDAVEALCSNR